MEGASFGVPLPERRREQRDGCTLVISWKRRPAIGTELAAVARCHDCPGQLEKGVVKIRLIRQGLGDVRQKTCQHGQVRCFATPRAGSSLVAGMCVAKLQSCMRDLKLITASVFVFLILTK